MKKLHNHEIPVAYSMLALLQTSVQKMYEPFQEFMFYWMAFNNIYTTLSDQAGHSRTYRSRGGAQQSANVGGLVMTQTDGPTEAKQLDIAFASFSDPLKHELIMHASTKFFVYRSPIWRGSPIENDKNGQRLNGVLKISRTVSSDYPVWTPMSTQLYESYVKGSGDAPSRETLAKEILEVLYAIRNEN